MLKNSNTSKFENSDIKNMDSKDLNIEILYTKN